jgi:predicted N-acetyltransferase YhbS
MSAVAGAPERAWWQYSGVNTSLRLLHRPPTGPELLRLRDSVAWDGYEPSLAEVAARETIYGVCLTDDLAVRGCARVVGDHHYLYVQDVIVEPKLQKQGWGEVMMKELTAWLLNQSETSYRALICEPGLVEFYEKFGFRRNAAVLMTMPAGASPHNEFVSPATRDDAGASHRRA